MSSSTTSGRHSSAISTARFAFGRLAADLEVACLERLPYPSPHLRVVVGEDHPRLGGHLPGHHHSGARARRWTPPQTFQKTLRDASRMLVNPNPLCCAIAAGDVEALSRRRRPRVVRCRSIPVAAQIFRRTLSRVWQRSHGTPDAPPPPTARAAALVGPVDGVVALQFRAPPNRSRHMPRPPGGTETPSVSYPPRRERAPTLPGCLATSSALIASPTHRRSRRNHRRRARSPSSGCNPALHAPVVPLARRRRRLRSRCLAWRSPPGAALLRRPPRAEIDRRGRTSPV
jgi:hypothetical protein